MPTFRVTQKLTAALLIEVPLAPTAPVERAEHEWFADLFLVQRRKCVIWVHRPTLLTFVRRSVTAAELREFHALFRYEFRTLIAALDLPESLIERFGVYSPPAYAKTNDRRIVGSMLDYRHAFEVMLELEESTAHADVRAVNAMLNRSPMSVLAMRSALEAVLELGSLH